MAVCFTYAIHDNEERFLTGVQNHTLATDSNPYELSQCVVLCILGAGSFYVVPALDHETT